MMKVPAASCTTWPAGHASDRGLDLGRVIVPPARGQRGANRGPDRDAAHSLIPGFQAVGRSPGSKSLGGGSEGGGGKEAEEGVTMSLSRPEIVDDLKAGSRAGTVSTH